MNENKTLKDLANIINITIKNEEIFKRAFIHRSYLNENKDIRSNERLEFLGDAVLEIIVSEYLFEKYDTHPEGDLTSFRAALVRTESLADEALKLNLGEFIAMSRGEETTGGRTRPYILANTMEALIGAIYLDQGLEVAREFILKNICYKSDEIIKNRLDIDPKSKLQELSQERLKETPAYELVDAWGPDHNKKFKMAAVIAGTAVSEGEGDSKQSAEQEAAAKALENWEEIEKKLV